MPESSLQPSPEIRSRLGTVAIVVIVLVLLTWPTIISCNLNGRGAADDLNFHWLAIQQFAQQWPHPDLSDYVSATTPGYHLILAPFAEMGIGHMGIQLIASGWTIALFGLLAWVVSARFGPKTLVVMLPMLLSMYVLFPGIWLLPDNAGWFGVLAILLLALKPDPSWKTWVLSGLILLGLIWMRQIHIWVAGVIWLGAWLGSDAQTPDLKHLFSSTIERTGRSIIAVACTVPAIAALVWFVLMWGGLVPPTFQGMHQGPNLATPGFILLQLAILSVFFLPMLWSRLKETWKYNGRWILLAIIVGGVLGLVPHSSYSYDAGRYSGWWNLIAKFPVIADRSPFFVLGSIFGSVALVVWLNLVSKREAWIWLGAFVGFTLAQSANFESWQRYHEPMLLMMILLILARSNVVERSIRSVMVGSVLLAMVLGSLTLNAMLHAQPVIQTSETQTQPQIEP
jgi:hypothetical protein